MLLTEEQAKPNLSLDIYCAPDGKSWSAVIRDHREERSGMIVWERHGCRTQHNAETAADAAWERLLAGAPDQ